MREMNQRIGKRAVRMYVHGRIITPSLFRTSPSAHSEISRPRTGLSMHANTHFRYSARPSLPKTNPNREDLPLVLPLTLEIPDIQLWMTELWHDFLIEPTPYLVASAICYVGGVLILVQYHWAVVWLACFFFRLLPWDEDLGFA
jgi:hypothetical protein